MVTPQFLAVNQEMRLGTQAICTGLTSLGQINTAQSGTYSNAFFNLSIGFERLGKIAFLIDWALVNSNLPSDKDLRRYGHNLQSLLLKTREIRSRCPTFEVRADYPEDEIVEALIRLLSDFAQHTRYFNLDFIVGGPSVSYGDPMAIWESGVAKPILARHYKDSRRRADEARAHALGTLVQPSTFVRFTAEDGSSISTASGMLQYSSAIKVVQRWAPFYALRLVRFLSYLLIELEGQAHQRGLDFVPYLSEYVGMFCNEESYLKRRKAWSLPS